MYVVARDDETWSVWSSFKNQGHKVIAGKTQSSVIIKKMSNAGESSDTSCRFPGSQNINPPCSK